VTTLSIETKLLALSQTAKEAIFINRLFKAMTLRLNKPLIINCDNTQTLQLVTEDTAKLITKLQHINIYQHWLRQEYAIRQVIFQWKITKEMIANGLTKALPKQRFQSFVNIIRIVDIKEWLAEEKQLEDLQDSIKAKRKDADKVMV